MSDDDPRRWDEKRKSDPDNAAFRRAIDNVFKRGAERSKEHAEDSAVRGRKARKRADNAKQRQENRKPDQRACRDAFR